MAIDLQTCNKVIRIIEVYLSHAGNESTYFQDTFDDLERLVMEVYGKQFNVFIDWDFNRILNRGVRNRVLQDLCSEFFLNIANGHESEDDPDTWTWRSRRLEYILHSRCL